MWKRWNRLHRFNTQTRKNRVGAVQFNNVNPILITSFNTKWTETFPNITGKTEKLKWKLPSFIDILLLFCLFYSFGNSCCHFVVTHLSVNSFPTDKRNNFMFDNKSARHNMPSERLTIWKWFFFLFFFSPSSHSEYAGLFAIKAWSINTRRRKFLFNRYFTRSSAHAVCTFSILIIYRYFLITVMHIHTHPDAPCL